MGISSALMRVRDLIQRVALSDATVLVQGETGTGKEMTARAIHYLGARRDHPFVPVNCGAIPDSLFENEFFGHAKGAFTDARAPQVGLIASAERGTLFLDEIETLSPKGQVALLRFLQDLTYRPLGASEAVLANVRVIAASNADVPSLVRSGSFRQDLLYRLRTIGMTMPPLRDRPGDLPLLVDHFLERFARQYETPPKSLDPKSLSVLTGYDWPGNVRELETLIHERFLLTDGVAIHIRNGDLPGRQVEAARSTEGVARPGMDSGLGFRAAKAKAVADFERAFLQQALSLSQGNVSRAARNCGKERRSFGKLLKKHSIDPRQYA